MHSHYIEKRGGVILMHSFLELTWLLVLSSHRYSPYIAKTANFYFCKIYSKFKFYKMSPINQKNETDYKMSNSARNVLKIRRDMAVFGGSSRFFSSTFFIPMNLIRRKPWNSIMKAVLKTTATAPPPPSLGVGTKITCNS